MKRTLIFLGAAAVFFILPIQVFGASHETVGETEVFASRRVKD